MLLCTLGGKIENGTIEYEGEDLFTHCFFVKL